MAAHLLGPSLSWTVEGLTCSQPCELQNLLYDISQIAIPFDSMDASEWQ